MNYDLAKKLKDAGFPQPDHYPYLWQEGFICQHEPNGGDHIHGKIYTRDCCDPAYDPSLSELIAACGREFYSVVRALEGDWRAFSETDGKNTVATGNGPTPEEAVAHLWLSLNSSR